MKIFFLALLVILSGCASTSGVGMRALKDATLWYPATGRSLERVDTVFVTHAIPEAKLPEGAHPLVLISHGNAGNPASLSWLAEYLASRGMFVAAPLHPGTNFKDVTPTETFSFWKRPAHLIHLLDRILADAELAPHIDHKHISAIGFSLGGSTVLLLAGDEYDTNRFAHDCKGRDCRLLMGVDQSRVSYLPPRPDDRIGRFIAIAPAFGAGFAARPLSHLLVIASQDDEVVPLATNAGLVAAPALIVKGAGHYSFLGRCAPEVSLPFCLDRGKSREALHAEIEKPILEFLEKNDGG